MRFIKPRAKLTETEYKTLCKRADELAGCCKYQHALTVSSFCMAGPLLRPEFQFTEDTCILGMGEINPVRGNEAQMR